MDLQGLRRDFIGSDLPETDAHAYLLDGFAIAADGPTFDGQPLEVRFFDNASR